MLILAAAKGTNKELSTPVREKSKGPITLIARHPRSEFMPVGITFSGQIIDSSSLVREIE